MYLIVARHAAHRRRPSSWCDCSDGGGRCARALPCPGLHDEMTHDMIAGPAFCPFAKPQSHISLLPSPRSRLLGAIEPQISNTSHTGRLLINSQRVKRLQTTILIDDPLRHPRTTAFIDEASNNHRTHLDQTRTHQPRRSPHRPSQIRNARRKLPSLPGAATNPSSAPGPDEMRAQSRALHPFHDRTRNDWQQRIFPTTRCIRRPWRAKQPFLAHMHRRACSRAARISRQLIGSPPSRNSPTAKASSTHVCHAEG